MFNDYLKHHNYLTSLMLLVIRSFLIYCHLVIILELNTYKLFPCDTFLGNYWFSVSAYFKTC